MDFNCRVLVIGDIIRDIQRNCSTVGLSLESPTMKTQFENIKENLGGSANVVLNLLELGSNVDYISVINKVSYIKRFHLHLKNVILVPFIHLNLTLRLKKEYGFLEVIKLINTYK